MATSHDRQCFNCGQTLEQSVAFCPHCGAPLPVAGSLFKTVGKVLAVLFCMGSALLCGASGACALVISTQRTSADAFFGGLVLLIMAALFFQAAIAISKRP